MRSEVLTFAQAQTESVCHVIDNGTPITENTRVAADPFRHCDINVANNKSMALEKHQNANILVLEQSGFPASGPANGQPIVRPKSRGKVAKIYAR